MVVFYIILFVLALWKVQFSGKGFFTEESLSKNATNSVKGIFIWLVFLSHLSSYVEYTSTIDLLGNRISLALGQLVVVCFFFYSGYGILESIKSKEDTYIHSLPKQRIIKTFLHFDLAVLIYYILQLFLNTHYSFRHILLAFIGWESFGNDHWYIFVILSLYTITWLSFYCFKNRTIAATVTTALTICFLVFLGYTRWTYWYDTAICYILGIWFSMFKEKIFAFTTKNNFYWLVCTVISLILFCIVRFIPFPFGDDMLLLIHLLFAPTFCVLVVLLLAKLKFENKVLIFSGQYLFEIFILQRIPMILFDAWGINDCNQYLYFFSCFTVTLLLSFIFRYFTSKIDSALFKRK